MEKKVDLLQKNLVFESWGYYPPGGFAKVRGKNTACEFYSCREDFNKVSCRIRRMLYCVHVPPRRDFPVPTAKSIAAFMSRVERKIDVNPRSRFGSTQRNNIIWIEPSPWWMRISMRRSLFTALLRSSEAYNTSKRNFEEALFYCYYLNDTKRAVRRFLAGHTHYTGRVCGWYSQFYYYMRYGNAVPIDQLLVKPPR